MSAEEKDAGGSAADPWDNVAAAAGAKSRELEAAEIARLLNPLMDDDEADDSGAAPEQLGEVSLGLTRETADADADRAAQRVYDELLERAGEAHPRPRIEPVRRFAQLAGMPQELYPIIQVAGTNGKTSTARIIETLLRAHGLRTGLFTSPHLVSFTERIQLDGVPIDGAELAFVWDSLQPALQLVDSELQQQGHGRITFFEALTVLAYAAFADAPVEVAVIEVGLGGQWDATNIADAAVSVFTPIDLDHTELLGDTLAQIARTKAGIIKSSSVVVSAAQDAAAMAEIEAVAAAQNASVHSAGRDFELISDSPAVGGRMISARSKVYGAEYKDLVLPLLGAHQAHNAVTALAAVEAFFKRKLDLETLELGLRAVTSPGRMQLIAADPAVLVDAAHNPHGARALVRAVRESFNFSSDSSPCLLDR